MLPFGLVQRGGLLPHRPIAGQRPFVQAQPRGQLIDARLVQDAPPGDAKFWVRSYPTIVFRRLQVAPVGGRFEPRPSTDTGSRLTSVGSGLAQQLLDDHFRLFV